MTDLQPTGLAFGRLKIVFCLVTNLLILVNHRLGTLHALFSTYVAISVSRRTSIAMDTVSYN